VSSLSTNCKEDHTGVIKVHMVGRYVSQKVLHIILANPEESWLNPDQETV